MARILLVKSSLFIVILVTYEPFPSNGFAPKLVDGPFSARVARETSLRIKTEAQPVEESVVHNNRILEEATLNDNWIIDSFESSGKQFSTVTTKNGKAREPKELKHELSKVAPLQSEELNARPFPMSMIVDMEEIKTSLILAAVNPRIGGVVISGRRGTGKSVAARAIHQLLPKYIERVKGNPYNVDPSGDGGIDSLLQNELLATGRTLQELETELVPTPFVQVPLNVMADSLLGTVDLEKSVETGRTEFAPGLLARAHRGVLYVDEINLLDEESVNILLNVIADGKVTIEREGVSVTYPCRPRLIATYNPEEGELREHLLDRIGVSLSVDATPLTVDDRVQVVENVVGFSESNHEARYEDGRVASGQDEEDLQLDIAAAIGILPYVKIHQKQILYLCEEATRAECEGQRAEIFATEVAKASAALDARTSVNAEDLHTAVRLAIAPRGNILPISEDSDDVLLPPPPAESTLEPLPPPPDQLMNDDSKDDQEEPQEEDEDADDSDNEPENDNKHEEEEDIEIPLEFMFGVDMTPIDPKLLYFNKWTRKGKGGKRSRIFNLQRGRFVKAILPKAQGGKLAVAATLRAAAPHQKLRKRIRAMKKGNHRREMPVMIEKDDFRIKRMAKKAGSLIIFVVDASGSMALNRMDAAKGAALTLLSEAYKSRDKICLIAFHDREGQVIVPPTKSMALTKNRLEGMPCGGGSPLAHALTLAMRTGLNAIKVKQDVGRVIVVLLSDGRANIPMCTSMGEPFDPSVDAMSKDGLPSRIYLKDETLAVAKKLGSLSDFNMLCVDTEDMFVSTGFAREIAKAAKGNYFHIVDTDSATVSDITKKALTQ